MYCDCKIACCKPQRCLLIARAFTFVNEQTALLRPFFRSKNREKRVGFPKIRTFLGSETASAGAKNRVSVSVSAMQPCSASFNSLPLPREYNITNMTAAKRYESVWNAFLNELSHNPTATLTSFLKRCNVRQGRMKRWMENNGLSVKEAKRRLRDCQHDGIGDPMSPLSEDSGSLFLPMATDKPAPRSESCDILSGVSLTFPDGTQVNIKRGSAQAVMSFLKLYQREDLPCWTE